MTTAVQSVNYISNLLDSEQVTTTYPSYVLHWLPSDDWILVEAAVNISKSKTNRDNVCTAQHANAAILDVNTKNLLLKINFKSLQNIDT